MNKDFKKHTNLTILINQRNKDNDNRYDLSQSDYINHETNLTLL